MSISATSASAAVNALAVFKLANGEYSASSVATDPAGAQKLQLMRLQDGNYGSLAVFAPSAFRASPVSRMSTGVHAALHGLTLGG
jgi:anti-sigma-K factor RskA